MSKSLIAVRRMLFNYIREEREVFGDEHKKLNEYVLQGVSNAGPVLGRTYFSLADYLGEENVAIEDIETPKMGNSEIKLSALCSYLEFALNFHHTLTKKATNFKSRSFSISGTTERAKEAMRIVWWIEGQIDKILEHIDNVGIPDADPPIEGVAGLTGEVSQIRFENHHFVF